MGYVLYARSLSLGGKYKAMELILYFTAGANRRIVQKRGRISTAPIASLEKKNLHDRHKNDLS
ncbi:MAG: hypothetical protein EBX41_02760 [Chitinophagia bacterium]|nr:hypothetical protein [Chitinophagia bacterium]